MKKLRVVMFSVTPMAGAPIRIARAINTHTEIEVRLVDLKRWAIFDHDHVHEEDPDYSCKLAQDADIIHFFNYIDARSKDFSPIDFAEMERNGKRLVRMFESTPMLVAKHMGIPLDEVIYDPIPQLVIAQYPERFYPRARVVPNIIPQNQPDYLPGGQADKWSVVFSPSWQRSAWDARWDTKGVPETRKMLSQVCCYPERPFKIISGRPFHEVMKVKRDAAIVVDDLVTGSYHLSGLEGLSLGKPTLGFLDDRTQGVLRWISGAQECPFISVRLEDAGRIIRYLLDNPLEREEIGQEGRKWIEKYWNDEVLTDHFREVYELLMEDPTKICRQNELALDTSMRRFFAISLPDQIYYSRRSRALKEDSLLSFLKIRLLRALRSIKYGFLSKK